MASSAIGFKTHESEKLLNTEGNNPNAQAANDPYKPSPSKFANNLNHDSSANNFENRPVSQGLGYKIKNEQARMSQQARNKLKNSLNDQ